MTTGETIKRGPDQVIIETVGEYHNGKTMRQIAAQYSVRQQNISYRVNTYQRLTGEIVRRNQNRRGPMKRTKSQPGPGAIQPRKDFIRLIKKRVPMAIDAISSIANLANPKNYKSVSGDWDKVLEALRKAVDNLAARVRSPEEAAPEFELREDEE